MPRPQKYRTKDEKAAANRAKSKRCYDKKKATASVKHPNRPGRPRKYETADQKQEANKAKNKRYYAKNRKILRVRQSVRHKEVLDQNTTVLPRALVNHLSFTDTPILNSSLPGSCIEIKSSNKGCEADIRHWCAQAEIVAAKLHQRIGSTPQEYIESVYTSYSFTRRKNDVRSEITETSKLQKVIYRCQDHILQLVGLGPEWHRAEEISKGVRKIIQWLEDILVYAMVDCDTLIIMHNNRELAYQRS